MKQKIFFPGQKHTGNQKFYMKKKPINKIIKKTMENINNKILPKLTLVGAGPGDAELITLKGIKVLGEADVILYDALVNTELLKYTRKEAKRIFVGKKKRINTFYHQKKKKKNKMIGFQKK